MFKMIGTEFLTCPSTWVIPLRILAVAHSHQYSTCLSELYYPTVHRIPRVSQVVLVVKKKPACQYRRHENFHSVPGSGRWPGKENGNPLQYSCLENPMGRGAWQVIVAGVAKSWTQLKWLSMHLMVHIVYLHFWIFIWCNYCQTVLFLFSLIRFCFLKMIKNIFSDILEWMLQVLEFYYLKECEFSVSVVYTFSHYINFWIYIYIYNNNSEQIKDSLCLFEVGGFSWQSLVGNGSNCGKLLLWYVLLQGTLDHLLGSIFLVTSSKQIGFSRGAWPVCSW